MMHISTSRLLSNPYSHLIMIFIKNCSHNKHLVSSNAEFVISLTLLWMVGIVERKKKKRMKERNDSEYSM